MLGERKGTAEKEEGGADSKRRGTIGALEHEVKRLNGSRETERRGIGRLTIHREKSQRFHGNSGYTETMAFVTDPEYEWFKNPHPKHVRNLSCCNE